MSLRGKQANDLVTQQRVLRAAVAQFLEKGYTGTTTSAYLYRSTAKPPARTAIITPLFSARARRKSSRATKCAVRLKLHKTSYYSGNAAAKPLPAQ